MSCHVPRRIGAMSLCERDRRQNLEYNCILKSAKHDECKRGFALYPGLSRKIHGWRNEELISLFTFHELLMQVFPMLVGAAQAISADGENPFLVNRAAGCRRKHGVLSC